MVLHYVEDVLFTNAAWSLAQPNIIFFSDESGQLQVWDLTHKKAEPKQVQGISGRTINGNLIIAEVLLYFLTTVPAFANRFTFPAICPYAHRDVVNGQETVTHFISVGDETGTLHVLILPKHLYTTCDQDVREEKEFNYK